MTLLYIVLSVFPIIQVESVSTFALKIILLIAVMNLVGVGILLAAAGDPPRSLPREPEASQKARSHERPGRHSDSECLEP